MYHTGIGLPRDFTLAKRYYELSIELSPKEAFYPATISLWVLALDEVILYLSGLLHELLYLTSYSRRHDYGNVVGLLRPRRLKHSPYLLIDRETLTLTLRLTRHNRRWFIASRQQAKPPKAPEDSRDCIEGQ